MTTRKRHIISILLQNEVGALTRVASLFSTRGYNIESLNVAPTDDPTVSRLTLVTTGTDAVIQQIVNQSLKLIDVVNVDDVTRDQHVERELLLIKLRAAAAQLAALQACVQQGGRKSLVGRSGKLYRRTDRQRIADQQVHRRSGESRRSTRGRAQRCAGDAARSNDAARLDVSRDVTEP